MLKGNPPELVAKILQWKPSNVIAEIVIINLMLTNYQIPRQSMKNIIE
jgi:hypothetical protein